PKPKPKPKAPPKPENKKVNLDKTKNEQQEALNRLKAMQAIEKLREEQQEKEAPKEYKGNVLSEGNSFTGLAQIEFDRYFSEVESALRQNWNLPKWLEDGDFRAQVRVMVDERGY